MPEKSRKYLISRCMRSSLIGLAPCMATVGGAASDMPQDWETGPALSSARGVAPRTRQRPRVRPATFESPSALVGVLSRARVLALGLDVPIDEFDHRHRGVVARAKSRLHDARIAAVAVLVARPSTSISFSRGL